MSALARQMQLWGVDTADWPNIEVWTTDRVACWGAFAWLQCVLIDSAGHLL